MNWIVQWNFHNQDTYAPGAEITPEKDGSVKYKNELMSPGTPIAKWASKRDFQSDRCQPELPNLMPDATYYLGANIDTKDQKTLILKLTFYNLFGESTGDYLLKDARGEVTIPSNVNYYTLELINAGATAFTFHWVQFATSEDDLLDKEQLELVEDIDGADTLNLVFLEPQRGRLPKLAPDIHAALKKQGDVASLAAVVDVQSAYERDEIKDQLKVYRARYKQVNLLAYGPVGEEAVTALSTGKDNVVAKVASPPENAWVQRAFDAQTSLLPLVNGKGGLSHGA